MRCVAVVVAAIALLTEVSQLRAQHQAERSPAKRQVGFANVVSAALDQMKGNGLSNQRS